VVVSGIGEELGSVLHGEGCIRSTPRRKGNMGEQRCGSSSKRGCGGGAALPQRHSSEEDGAPAAQEAALGQRRAP
jgi:hypothetical protein